MQAVLIGIFGEGLVDYLTMFALFLKKGLLFDSFMIDLFA